MDSQWEFAVWLGEFKLGLWDNLKEWDVVGGRRQVQEGGDVYTYYWFMLMYGRSQHNTVKQLPLN